VLLLGWDSDRYVGKPIWEPQTTIHEKNSNHDSFMSISDKIDQLVSKVENDSSVMISPSNTNQQEEKKTTKNTNLETENTQDEEIEDLQSIEEIIKKNQLEKKDTSKESQTEPYTPRKSTFGWKQLGSCEIIFDPDRSENIYTIKEPVLTDNEQQIKQKLEYLFRVHTDVDVTKHTTDEKKEHLIDILNTIIEVNKLEINASSKDKIFYYILQQFIGFSKIDILMMDEEIEDISCDGPTVPIFIFHRKFESLRTNIYFDDADELDDFVFKLAQLCGKQLSIYEPIVDGRLPDGSRLQTTLGKTVTKGSTFTIRRINENPLTPIDLIENKTLTKEMAAYFWFLLQHGVSILFCGGTASGKTTLLNALSLFLPPTYKIVSAEDTREINLPHENWIAGTTRQGFISSGNDQSNRDIDMFDLVKAALRQRPQIIIVGEVRGKEANTMFQAMATGHLSYSTMHANDMQTLIQRLENHPIDLPRNLMVSLDLVVFIKSVKTLDGKVARRINEVIEIIKLDAETNRLITVIPYTYSGILDDSYQFHGNSNMLNKITKIHGWSEDALHEELKRRQHILEWMQEKKINSYKEVGKIVSMYTKNPQAFHKLMKEWK